MRLIAIISNGVREDNLMDKRDCMELAQKSIKDIKKQLEHIDFMYSRSFFDEDSAFDVYKASEKIADDCETIQGMMSAIEDMYGNID